MLEDSGLSDDIIKTQNYWYSPDDITHKAICTWALEALREKTRTARLAAALIYFIIIFIPSFCLFAVSETNKFFIFNLIFILILCIVCYFIKYFYALKVKRIKERKYSIADVTLHDKDKDVSRYGCSMNLSVKLPDGIIKKCSVLECTYNKTDVDTHLVMIKYEIDDEGFADIFDIAVISENQKA